MRNERHVGLGMNVLFYCILILVFLVFAPCPARTDDNQRNALSGYFPTQQAAITNGVAILDLIQKRTPEAKQRLQQYIGKLAAFYGSVAPPGGNADLMISTNVLLKVEIVPYKDVRPHAAVWETFVLGKIKGFDYTNSVVSIVARPEDWHRGATW